MIDTKHLLKTIVAWINIICVVCFAGVALFPGIRSGFMKYGLHTSVDTGQNILTFGTFFFGLIIWNIVAILAVWLFAVLFNFIKR